MAYIETVKVEDGTGKQVNPATEESLELLRRVAHLLKPLSMITGAGSNRLSIDVNTIGTISGGVTISNITGGTLPTVTTLNQIAGITGYEHMRSLSRQAYNSGIRSNIS